MSTPMKSPRRNIELKARCSDLAAARASCRRLGATFVARLDQVDTYFATHRGRLKLRQISDRPAELIAYVRADSTEPRASDYYIVPVDDSEALRAALQSTLGTVAQVIKQREIWMWENVRIHLDVVERLGSFIEFEALLGPGDTDEQGHQKIARLCVELHVEDEHRLAMSYIDMLNTPRGAKASS